MNAVAKELWTRMPVSVRRFLHTTKTDLLARRSQNQQVGVVKDVNWQKYFSDQLSGTGLEIGALHQPMLTHERMQVDYIDRLTTAELRLQYPELNDLPLVEPNLIGDGETLANVANDSYDFLIASHVIEHMKNPLGSLQQWCRVVKPGGKVYLAIPDKRATFDVNRERTSLAHMILDYQRPSADRDYEHYLDYANLVNHTSGDAAIAEADRLWAIDYSIHFHVFIPEDVTELVNWFSAHVSPVKILKGPVMNAGSHEFHLLLQVD